MSDKCMQYGLLGYPLIQSYSTYLHSKLFSLSKEDNSSYILIETKRENLNKTLDYLKSFNGFNVTIPYKEEVYKKLDIVDEESTISKSVNTVIKQKNGKLKGYNTDRYGFLSLVDTLGCSLNRKVLLLGAGGTARMIAYEIAKQNGELYIKIRNSSEDKAQKLKDDIKKLYKDARVKIVYDDKIKDEKFDLVINATPCGMYPNNLEEMTVPKSVLDKTCYLIDVVYNPYKTKLIKEAEIRGVKCIGGAKMLVMQAVKSHEIWTGKTHLKSDIDNLIIEIENMSKGKLK